jgi:hypothetical protein
VYPRSDQEAPKFHSREKAAKILKVPKKSLDDYLLYLRKGKFYGFDYKSYKFELFGVVRQFVNRAKQQDQEKGRVHLSPVSFATEFRELGAILSDQ